jgi:hypothetical protein
LRKLSYAVSPTPQVGMQLFQVSRFRIQATHANNGYAPFVNIPHGKW